MGAGQVVTKAFTNGKARYSGQQNSAQVAETAKIEMMVEEAMMILNLEKMDAEAPKQNYKYLFKVNEKKTAQASDVLQHPGGGPLPLLQPWH